MITGATLVAGPVPASHLDPFSVTFPPGQHGLVLIAHPPALAVADVLLMQEGNSATCVRFTDRFQLQVPVNVVRDQYRMLRAQGNCFLYLFNVPAELFGSFLYVVTATPSLIVPFLSHPSQYARPVLRRLPPRASLVEYRSWRSGIPSVRLMQCEAPLDFLDRVPPLCPGELRVYDLDMNRRIQAIRQASAPAPPLQTEKTETPLPLPPQAIPTGEPIGAFLWSAYKRILTEKLGRKAECLIASAERTEGADRSGPLFRDAARPRVLEMIDMTITKGPLLKRKELRTVARELINDVYARHHERLSQAGLTDKFQEFYSKWKGE